MNFIKRFMAGRYGSDQLSLALIFAAIIINILALIFQTFILEIIAGLLIAYCIFRMLSRSLDKRRAENVRFLSLSVPLRSWVSQKLAQIKCSKTHKFFRCPSCKNVLRVPRGKGKLHITCPKCGERFDRKT